MSNNLSLNPADIANMTRAVRLAQSRGAYQMEETSQLLESVVRLEGWVAVVKQAQEQADQEKAQAQTQDPTEPEAPVAPAEVKPNKEKK